MFVTISSLYLEPGLDIVSEFLSLNWDVVLAQPVRVQDWSAQGSILLNVWEVLQCNLKK